MKLHNAVAATLQDQAVEVLFGLMGDANLLYLTDWVRDGGAFIHTVIEGAAVGMADGYARSSGRVGVASITHGPAMTNALTALTEAVRARSRVLVITGDTSPKRYERQDMDLQAAARVSGAEYHEVLASDHVVDDIAMAMARVRANDTPLVLNIPQRLMDDEVAYDRSKFITPLPQAIGPDEDVLDRALGLIASARRPIVLAGRGAVCADARGDILALADILAAPVATTLLGKDLFRGEPFDLGIFGTLSHPVAMEAISSADCVISFGASLNQFTTARNSLLEGKRVVQCDLEPRNVGRFRPVECGVVGDARVVAQSMVQGLMGAGYKAGGFRTAGLQERLRARSPYDDFTDRSEVGRLDMRSVLIRLDELLPQDRAVITDGGRFQGSVWSYLHVRDPRAFMHAVNFSSIGLGTSLALGYSVADRDRLTVGFCGDGGGAMSLMEFVTAVRHELPFVLVMLNDGAYGSEYRKLQQLGLDPKYSLLEWPDFAVVARAMGGHGVTVNALDDLEEVISLVETDKLPLLVDVRCDPSVDFPVLH